MNNELLDIMTIEDVAEYLRIPVSSAYKLAQGGKIPGQKVGRHWSFHRPTLVKWIAGQAFADGKKTNTETLNFS